LAWAYLELGDVAAAEDAVSQAVTQARAASFRLALVDALRVQARVAARQGRWEEAERTLEEGLALVRSMRYPYAEAGLLHAYGLMHVQKGEREPALGWLEAALAIFQRLGARKEAERTEHAIRALQQPCREAG
jgi:tetratricopeptide (TPR) repeat protein